jgi:hypothetical protein
MRKLPDLFARTSRAAINNRNREFLFIITALLGCWLFAPGATLAQPVPKLTSISPEWIQRGTATDVTLMGESLAEVTTFAFNADAEDFNAVVAAPAKPEVRLESTSADVFSSGTPTSDKRITAKLMISRDAPLGPVQLRVITPGGFSNPLTIRITDTPEIIEAGNNHVLTNAPKVTLPVGISGKIRVAEQVDYFGFAAKAGERLMFAVQANSLGSPLDSTLAVFDSKGTELARNEDANGADSLLLFTVPIDGDYVLMIRDFQHRGGDNFTYHITAGALPYVQSIFPFGGQRGQSVEINLVGINLEGAEKMNMVIDANAPGGPQEIRAHTVRGVSNPLQFDVSFFPDVTETEPNNAITNANPITTPGNVNGRISESGEVDIFRITIEKAQRLIFEVYARRFNSKLDPLLTVMNSKGEVMQRNDDAAGADARITQLFDQPGEYFISIRDLLERGGEGFGYRLSIDPPPPADFSAKLLADTVRLHRSGRTIVRVEVNRGGIAGPVEIIAENLPAGVTAAPLVIPESFPTGLLQLTADAEAELGSAQLELKAVALVRGKTEMRSVQSVSGSKPATINNRGRVRKTKGTPVGAAYLTVLEPAPFTVDWLTLAAGVEQNDSTKVLAEVKRHAGFTGEIKISAEGYSAGNEAITRSFEVDQPILTNSSTRTEISLKAKPDSETGTRSIYARAEASIGGQTLVEYSRAMPFRIGEFPYTLVNSLPRLSVTPPPVGSTNNAASQAEFSVRTERRGLFTEDIALSLEGLPEGVTVNTTNIARGTTEAGFKLTATDKAKLGTSTVVVVGTANVNGRQFRLRGPELQLIINALVETSETAAVK